MLSQDFLARVLAEQHRDGHFHTTIHRGTGQFPDNNGFTTALVLRALRIQSGAKVPASMRRKAFSFLSRCRCPELAGAYRFWPIGSDPDWCSDLTADADDTAVILLERYLYGLIDRQTVREHALKALLNHRLRKVEMPAPPWLVQGTFLTMLSRRRLANPVDCCVNANVVALLAAIELKDVPGYAPACETIQRGLEWAGTDVRRACALTPYYADPSELRWAVENALAVGATELLAAARLLRQCPWANKPLDDADRGIYGNPHSVWWSAPAVHYARRRGVVAQRAARAYGIGIDKTFNYERHAKESYYEQ